MWSGVALLDAGSNASTSGFATKFTVAAYVKVGDVTCVSEQVKTYSVAEMVKTYYENEYTQVEHLYNYLVDKGWI